MTADQPLSTGAVSRAEIERTIDDLDMALASGKIDMETHRQLHSRWRQKLQTAMEPFQTNTAVAPDEPSFYSPPRSVAATGGPPPNIATLTQTMVSTVQGLANQMPQPGAGVVAATRRVACPDCGAPAGGTPAANGTIRCEYCDATFTIEKAEHEDFRLQEELRRWLDSMVAVGAAGGTVDAASRHFIFTERLYPSLSLEVSRHLEAFDTFRSAPLCIVHGGTLFGDRRTTAPVSVDMSALRRIVVRLDAPEVRSFAITPEDRSKLDDLAIRSTLILRIGTTIRQLALDSAAGYRSAQKNVESLGEMLQTAAGNAALAQAQFLRALTLRFGASGSALGVLARLYEPNGTTTSDAIALLRTARANLDAAAQQLAASGYAPIEVVSAQRGLLADREQLQLLERLLELYGQMGGDSGVPLPRFVKRLEQFASTVGLHPTSAAEVEEFLAVIALWTGHGGLPVATVNEWSWTAVALDGIRRRPGLFGREETLRDQRDYWHPFHCFPLRYSVVKGSVFKGGVEQNGYVLVSAVGAAYPVFAAAGTPLFDAIEGATPGLPADGRERALPLRSLSQSGRDAEQHTRGVTTIRNPRLGQARILLLPACFAELEGQSGRRQVNLTLCGAHNGDAQHVLDAYALLQGHR